MVITVTQWKAHGFWLAVQSCLPGMHATSSDLPQVWWYGIVYLACMLHLMTYPKCGGTELSDLPQVWWYRVV